ncbi:MAG: amino acid ABC transporter ATP-binding protein [Candidatus Brockarchaeota archaeon]|nr:amino acid ABC transporter ATP-binding protein [Candidatus Brockarchaeota archaeon]MBO3800906.1 amino acid ABC transporter ATP-binding protein [Candidatus Brockarchaeota archaeon]
MLSIKNLKVSYSNIEVLKGINLDVKKGEKVVIIGPSGSGKSTLLKAIDGLVKINEGEIIFDGVKVNNENIIKVRSEIGFVFQNYTLFPHFTLLKNVMFPLQEVKKLSKEKSEKIANEALESVGLLEKAQSYPFEVSGGQRQRAAIARALALNPKLLLLDEPTSALDPEFVGEVLEILEEIAKKGITMIVVTHEVDFAEDVATNVVFIDGGEIIEMGPPSEVLVSPRSERLKKFLSRIIRKRLVYSK